MKVFTNQLFTVAIVRTLQCVSFNHDIRVPDMSRAQRSEERRESKIEENIRKW